MRFRILGPVEVQVDGGWHSISATKWRTVLAVLLLRAGEVVLTDQLISEVWPENAPATAVNLVSVYVLRLRRLIGDPDGQILAPAPAGISCGPSPATSMPSGLTGWRRRAARPCQPGIASGPRVCSSRLSTCGRGAGLWPTSPTLTW